MSFWKITLIFILFSSGLACNRAPEDGLNHCMFLSQGVEELTHSLDALSTQRLACEKAENDEDLQQEIYAFMKQCSDILAKVDTLYAAHEIPCKRSYIYRDQFEACFERVYQPFVQVHALLIGEIQKLLVFLQKHPSEVLLAPVVQSTDQLVRDLKAALRSQLGVCSADFGQAHCQEMARLIESSIPAMNTADSLAPVPQAEQGVVAPDQGAAQPAPQNPDP